MAPNTETQIDFAGCKIGSRSSASLDIKDDFNWCEQYTNTSNCRRTTNRIYLCKHAQAEVVAQIYLEDWRNPINIGKERTSREKLNKVQHPKKSAIIEGISVSRKGKKRLTDPVQGSVFCGLLGEASAQKPC